MWGPQIMEMWQVAEQENMRRAERRAMLRDAARAGTRSVVLPHRPWRRARRDRRDGS